MKNIRNAAFTALVLSVIACGSQVVEFPLDESPTFGNTSPDAGDDSGSVTDSGGTNGGTSDGTSTDGSTSQDGGLETGTGVVPCDCDNTGFDAGPDATVPATDSGTSTGGASDGGTSGGSTDGDCEERTRTCYIKFGWCVAACAHSCQVKFPRSCGRRAHCVTECKETCVCSYNECRKH